MSYFFSNGLFLRSRFHSDWWQRICYGASHPHDCLQRPHGRRFVQFTHSVHGLARQGISAYSMNSEEQPRMNEDAKGRVNAMRFGWRRRSGGEFRSSTRRSAKCESDTSGAATKLAFQHEGTRDRYIFGFDVRGDLTNCGLCRSAPSGLASLSYLPLYGNIGQSKIVSARRLSRSFSLLRERHRVPWGK